MKIIHTLEVQIRQILDRFYARWPQAVPDKDRLQHCKIISHRGEYDNRNIFENTMNAFDRAKEQGVWGIEFDLRWTKDLNPVAIHDADLRRVFGLDFSIRQLTLAELKSRCPLVPSLAEMIQRYGKEIHLMIEIKAEHYPDPVGQNRILSEHLFSLEPEKDYHLLTMRPEMFSKIECVPRSALLPVARFNFSRLSKMAIAQNYSGLAGHYVLLTGSRLKKHKELKQKLATGYVNSKNCLFRELNRNVEWTTGYVNSKNCLFRELNRNVEWMFSDNAVELQKVVNRLLQDK
jgi:glycerophosphoryl diester phosphodiesterase